MFYGVLILFIGMLDSAFAASSGAISILHPKTGEWCLFGLENEGPRKLSVNEVGKYVIRIENKSRCNLEHVRFMDLFPKQTAFSGATPTPSRVRNRVFPKGPVIYWNGLKMMSGASRTFEINLQVTDGPAREIRNEICLATPREAEEKYCTYFTIKVRP